MNKTRLAVTAAALSILLPAPAIAQHMNADVFYQRAMKLKKKGPLALFAKSEIKALVGEVRAAGTRVKETRLAIERTGKHGRYCPPKQKREMGTDEYLKGIGSIPQAERRRIDMVEATTRMLAAKFPCPR